MFGAQVNLSILTRIINLDKYPSQIIWGWGHVIAENQFDLLWYRDEVWLVVIDG